MGYVNISQLSQFIPPSDIVKVGGGVWTSALVANVLCQQRAALNSDFQVYVPVSLISSPIKTQGAKILTMDLWYKIEAADADMLAPACFKTTLATNGSPVTAALYSGVTIDANHTNAFSAGNIGDHQLTLTFNDPPYFLEDTIYSFGFACNTPNLAVFTLFGAQVSFRLRI